MERGGEGGSRAVNEPFTPTGQYCSPEHSECGIAAMRCVRNWAVGSAIAALILLSPILAFLMIMATEVLIDGVMAAGMTAVSAVAIGAVGWVLFRRTCRSEIARQSGSKELCEGRRLLREEL